MKEEMKLMTPGPTMVAENVRRARSRPTTNPDLDLDFYKMYRDLCKEIGDLLCADLKSGEAYILGGEGILSLEAACASLTEPGDDVLVLDNGIFGKGFADFVKIYGGNPTLYTSDYQKPINMTELEEYLKENNNFKYATVVQCDTPSGVLNDVGVICPLLKRYGIATVVDAVAATFGDEVRVTEWDIDILCGGSQKALSAPPGLAFVTISKDAMQMMKERKTPIASFYCNLLMFENYYQNKWFPYTMPISDIYGLQAAIENVKKDSDVLNRHKKIAEAVRYAITEAGLDLYLKEGYASTVTAIEVPQGMSDKEILHVMKERYGIMIAGCFDVLEGKVVRIGHMGNNARISDVSETLEALTQTMQELGQDMKVNMKDAFLSFIEEGMS